MSSNLCLACFLCAFGSQAIMEREWEALNGTWSVVSMELKGKSLLKNVEQPTLVVVLNGKVTITATDGSKQQLMLSIDPSVNPKTATSTFEDNNVGVLTAVAIYSVEGDEMKICFDVAQPNIAADKRPKRFDSDEGFLVFLKRVRESVVRTNEARNTNETRNSVGMRLVRIPKGEFLMGSIGSAVENEKRHRVRINRTIYMSACEVTREEYERVIGKNQARSEAQPGSSRAPIAAVSWHDAVAFCQSLSSLAEETRAGRWYRLPTEAEWEYACRAGTDSPFCIGRFLSIGAANIGRGNRTASINPGVGAMEVGQFSANAFGFYDMHGNVAEWCGDWYAGYYTSGSTLEDPQGPLIGDKRVVRGGSYLSRAEDCRSTARSSLDPTIKDAAVGFRIVCELRKTAPDFEGIAKSVAKRLNSCVWDFEEVHRDTEHPSRYAAITLSPPAATKTRQQVRVFMRHEVKKGKRVEGFAEWAMKGEAEVGMNVTRNGENVHVHLFLFLNDLLVREGSLGEPGRWHRRTGFTDRIMVELWSGPQAPESFDSEVPFIFRSGIRIDENLEPLKNIRGEKLNAERFGWLGQYEKIPFKRRPMEAKIEWMGGSFQDVLNRVEAEK